MVKLAALFAALAFAPFLHFNRSLAQDPGPSTWLMDLSATMTMGDLATLCGSDDDALQSICRFYLLGWLSGLVSGYSGAVVLAGADNVQELNEFLVFAIPICLPDYVDTSLLGRVVVLEAQKDPSLGDESARVALFHTFSQIFPCDY